LEENNIGVSPCFGFFFFFFFFFFLGALEVRSSVLAAGLSSTMGVLSLWEVVTLTA